MARICSDPHHRGCQAILARHNNGAECGPCFRDIPIGARPKPSVGEHRSVLVACATAGCTATRKLGHSTVARAGGVDGYQATHPCIYETARRWCPLLERRVA